MKEILIYSGVYDWTAEDFIREMNAANGEDVTIRINTNGGSPIDSYGMIAKQQEYKGKIKIKVDGKAYSTGAFMLLYSNDVEALDVSEFLFHRAAYGSYIEGSTDNFTPELKANLNRINGIYRKAMEAKLDVAKFEKMKGVTLDQLFSLDTRIDVKLNAKEAKEIGLIDKIVNITPSIKAQVESLYMGVAAKSAGIEFAPAKIESKQDFPIIKKSTMDINKLKAEHPDVFAQVKALGTSEEKDRVGAWMVFVDVDAKAVSEGIKSDKAPSLTAMSEFSMKALSAKQVKAIEAENAPVVAVAAEGAPKTEAEKNILAFEQEADKLLGIKKEGGK